MSSLHRDPRGKSPYWYAAFTDATGKRRFKSTKQIDRVKAQEVLRGWDKVVQMGRQQTLGEVQVRKVIQEIYESVNPEKLQYDTTRAFLKNWIEGKEAAGKSTGTTRRYSDVADAFVEYLGPKADALLQSVRPADVSGFRDSQLKGGRSASTANMAVKTLRIAFGVACRLGMIPHNPAAPVDLLPSDRQERKAFTVEQIKALLAVADVEWRGMILLGAYHGLRLGDASSMSWSNFDPERRTLTFVPKKSSRSAKGAKPLEIPLHETVLDYLNGLPVRSSDPKAPLFPRLAKRKLNGRTGLSAQFRELMHKAGIITEGEQQERKAGAGRRVFELGYHALRHTAVSLLANAGVSEEQRMKLTGHKSAEHKRYTHLEIETLRAAVGKLPSLS